MSCFFSPYPTSLITYSEKFFKLIHLAQSAFYYGSRDSQGGKVRIECHRCS